MSLVNITVDGQKIAAERGEALMPVLLKNGYDIPHMCFNEEMPPYGACRLCLVEIEQGGGRKVHTSCSFPVSEGLIVHTASDKILRQRRMIAELLLARCPDVPQIKDLAKRLGVEDAERFTKKKEGCILCGLCTRACEQVVGVSAISFVGRGPEKYVATPFLDESHECIGCGSCVYICPVDFIKMEEDEKVRRFPQWKVEFEMALCKKCGQKVAPKKQIEVMKARSKDLPPDWFDLCQNCR